MTSTKPFDIQSATKTLDNTSFDDPQNRTAREFLRGQMDDAARDEFDDAVAGLRASLATMAPEARAAHRGFRCGLAPGDGVQFVVKLAAD